MRAYDPLRKHIGIIAAVIMTASPAIALRAPDLSGDDAGAIAVYTFDENGGVIAGDTSANGAALPLRARVDGNLATADGTVIRTNAQFSGGLLYMNPKPNGNETGDPQLADKGYQSAQKHRTFLASDDGSGNLAAATKLNSCTSGFTVQAFIRPYFPFQGNDNGGNLIVGLSNSRLLMTTDNAMPLTVNWGLFQTGNVGSEAINLVVRDSQGNPHPQSSIAGGLSSVRQMDNPGKWTEVIATMDSNSLMTVFVNRVGRSSTVPFTVGFAPDAVLVIGNELTKLTLQPDGSVKVDNQRNWSGEIKHLAIYCKSFTRAEIVGDKVLNKSSAAVVKPAAKGTAIGDTKVQARKMIERLTGGPVPIDLPMIKDVEAKIIAGDRIGAAKIVTGDATLNLAGHPDFLNVVVKQMALKMSNHEETIRAPLNDFAASFVGVTRDERSAKELLTEDFYYMGDPAKVSVRNDLFNDMLVSNNHYQDLESAHWDLGKVLIRKTGQQVATSATGAFTASPDPAGVITSRAFMSAHAIAGTNRRLVEYAFREFMCVPMANMADTSASPARIGRDVDRLPGGDAQKFETSCKGCHTVMDGFRGAFAHWDFANTSVNGVNYQFTRNAQVNAKNADFGFPMKTSDGNGVVTKMTHNETVFPNGYLITDDSFVNNAVGAQNKNVFGWRGTSARGGFGVNQFGHMIADSSRFSQCMAKRVFETVCKVGVTNDATVSPVQQALALQFESGGYNLRSLFQQAAANPACAAGQGR